MGLLCLAAGMPDKLAHSKQTLVDKLAHSKQRLVQTSY